MLDNFIDGLEKLVISLFKFFFRYFKIFVNWFLKHLLRFLKYSFEKTKSYLSNKISIPKERFRNYYDKYLLPKVNLLKKFYNKFIFNNFKKLKNRFRFLKNRKLVFRVCTTFVFIMVLIASYFVGPRVYNHYQASNNSLSFVEYNTHVENNNINTSNSNVVQVNNQVEQPAPEPEPEPVVDTSYRWPTEDGYYITTYFSGAHDGIDIAGCGWNSNIYAIYSGEVVTSSYTSTNGNYIIIKDDKGVYSMYAHLANKYVWAGQRVERGQVIGGMGSTGFSTGTHLHFSTWHGYPYYGGYAFNPYTIY